MSSDPSVSASRGPHWLNHGLVIAIAGALLGMFWIIFQTIEVERAQREQVQITTRALVILRNINKAAIQAENGQRGYLITLDEVDLEPFERGRAELLPAIALLRANLDPIATERQDELLDTLEQSARAKLQTLTQSVLLARSGDLEQARAQLLTSDGRAEMARLQSAVRELEVFEQDALDRALARAARAEHRTPWLVLGLLILVIALLIYILRLIRLNAEAEAEAAQAKLLSEARDRADLLAQELNHRVKNLFATILAIVTMSGRSAPEAEPVLESITQRIRALLTAHEVTQGSALYAHASLQSLIETTLAPYRSEAREASLDGIDLDLPERLVTPLGMVLHELTTNAIKHGAWAQEGLVEVSWEQVGDEVHLDWRETGRDIEEKASLEGFGTQLLKASARQINGSIDRELTASGCIVRIRFPLDRQVEAA